MSFKNRNNLYNFQIDGNKISKEVDPYQSFLIKRLKTISPDTFPQVQSDAHVFNVSVGDLLYNVVGRFPEYYDINQQKKT